jgi:hypothetical protein
MTAEDHTHGPAGCDSVGAFVDGELEASEAAAFRRHLVKCIRCQQQMHALMQLEGLAAEDRQEAPALLPLPPLRRPRRLARWALPALALAAGVAAVTVVGLRRGRSADVPTLLASLDARTVSGWPSAAGAAQYKPYRTARGVQFATPAALAEA